MIGEYKRYDVVLIDFGENTIGSEQGWHQTSNYYTK